MPQTREHDLYETPGGVMRIDRVYYHEGGRCWVVEFHRYPQRSATKDIHWEPENAFLKNATHCGRAEA